MSVMTRLYRFYLCIVQWLVVALATLSLGVPVALAVGLSAGLFAVIFIASEVIIWLG